MLPFGRRPRLKAVTVLGVLGVYAYIQTYFVMSPQDRSGMLSWYVIALASVGCACWSRSAPASAR